VSTSSLTDRVLALADQSASLLGDLAAAELEPIRAALREPIRVAVVGRVKAGKSTLVNALLGQRVAPTDVGECTRVVTWYRYGHPERVDVLLRDGSTRAVQLQSDGLLPATLNMDPQQVASLQVRLSNTTLRDLTLIDTPGLASVNEETSAATEELLSLDHLSSDAASRAQALAFVVNETVRADEVDVLRRFRATAGEIDVSAANAIGVLTKADKVGGGSEDRSLATATVMAERLAKRLRSELGTVIPVVGLLAETAEAALLTENDAANLARLAQLTAEERTALLLSPDRFLSRPAPLSRPERERLLALLDLFGIERALEWIDQGVRGADRLRAEFRGLSGVGRLRALLVQAFRHHDDALRARWGLNAIDALGFDRRFPESARRRLRDRAEQVRLDPEMHTMAELDALHLCASGEVTLPDPLLEEVRRIAGGADLASRLGAESSDAAALRRAAVEGAARWRRFRSTGASPRQATVAQAIIRSYELAWEQLDVDAVPS